VACPKRQLRRQPHDAPAGRHTDGDITRGRSESPRPGRKDGLAGFFLGASRLLVNGPAWRPVADRPASGDITPRVDVGVDGRLGGVQRLTVRHDELPARLGPATPDASEGGPIRQEVPGPMLSSGACAALPARSTDGRRRRIWRT